MPYQVTRPGRTVTAERRALHSQRRGGELDYEAGRRPLIRLDATHSQADEERLRHGREIPDA